DAQNRSARRVLDEHINLGAALGEPPAVPFRPRQLLLLRIELTATVVALDHLRYLLNRTLARLLRPEHTHHNSLLLLRDQFPCPGEPFPTGNLSPFKVYPLPARSDAVRLLPLGARASRPLLKSSAGASAVVLVPRRRDQAWLTACLTNRRSTCTRTAKVPVL